jgi:hypothetical protein
MQAADVEHGSARVQQSRLNGRAILLITLASISLLKFDSHVIPIG